MRNGYRLGLCVLACTVLLAGCDRSEQRASEAAIETASGGELDVEHDRGTMTIRRSDGATARIARGKSLALPDDFPADVYRPPQHEVVSVADMEGAQIVIFTTDATLAATRSAASKQMLERGWKQMTIMEGATGSILGYEKDKRQVVLSFGPYEGRTAVNVQLATKRR